MPGKKSGGAHDHGSSILRPRVYEALRKEGMDKGKAAAISNAMAHKGKGGKSAGGKKK